MTWYPDLSEYTYFPEFVPGDRAILTRQNPGPVRTTGLSQPDFAGAGAGDSGAIGNGLPVAGGLRRPLDRRGAQAWRSMICRCRW